MPLQIPPEARDAAPGIIGAVPLAVAMGMTSGAGIDGTGQEQLNPSLADTLHPNDAGNDLISADLQTLASQK